MKENGIPTYKINADVSCRIEGDNDVILYHPDLDDFTVINSSGLKIWKFLEVPHSVDEICSHLMESYDEKPESDVITQEILTFLDSLGEQYISKT